MKFLSVLQSRKFWASLLSMGAAVGLLTFGEGQQAELAAQIVAGIGALYTLAVALEDGLTNRQ